MEGDLVFCFVPFGFDLGSCCCCCWDDIFEGERERERERGVVGVVTFEIWVLFFLSEF